MDFATADSILSQAPPSTGYAFPILIGLVLVTAFVVLSVFVWLWAMRRPPVPPVESQEPEEVESEPPPPPLDPKYVALGLSDVRSILRAGGETDESWPDLLHQQMPAETAFVKLGEHDRTLSETNEKSLQAAIDSKPTILTLWQVVGDATSRTPLTAYLKELRSTLQQLVDETEATIYLLNLPDLSFLIAGDTEERKALVRGGAQQWNHVISEVSISHGNRVHIVDLFPGSADIVDAATGNRALATLLRQEMDLAER